MIKPLIQGRHTGFAPFYQRDEAERNEAHDDDPIGNERMDVGPDDRSRVGVHMTPLSGHISPDDRPGAKHRQVTEVKQDANP